MYMYIYVFIYTYIRQPRVPHKPYPAGTNELYVYFEQCESIRSTFVLTLILLSSPFQLSLTRFLLVWIYQPLSGGCDGQAKGISLRIGGRG